MYMILAPKSIKILSLADTGKTKVRFSIALDGDVGSQMKKSCGNEIGWIKMLCHVTVTKIIFGKNDRLFPFRSLQIMYLLDMTCGRWTRAQIH